MGDATDIQGKYVSSITIAGGGILVLFGNEANTRIGGETLGLQPGASVNGDVIWKCGTAPNPLGWSAASIGSAASTSVPGKYLPSSCR